MEGLKPRLEALVGAQNVKTGADALEAANSPWTRLGAPAAVVRPATTKEVAGVLALAHQEDIGVTAWGGRTGLVDGARADGAIALSLERMRAIEDIDPAAATMTVQAGCVLETACQAADEQGLFLPLDLGARGSATIGGNISTNAGGNRVLRYGMMRDMVLGLEAVLADGTVLSSMNSLIKNNAGYDLKQLFIGSEGTLGIVTRAVLRLRPKPISQCTAFLAVDRFEALAPLLRLLEAEMSGALSAFEVLWPEFYELVTTEPAQGKPILPHGSLYYVLTEAMGADPVEDQARFERALEKALEAELITDASIAKSGAERARMWALRDDVGQTRRNAPNNVFDISLAISQMDGYLKELKEALDARWPGNTLVVFGHLGDGNLHVIVGVGDAGAHHDVDKLVYDLLKKRRGSVSAEHGIGLSKREFLDYSRNAQEVALMRTLKVALDPKNILNPGKILAE
jgi:FAD/FMN-containing dehydrogenase